jgi:hypothetical protein
MPTPELAELMPNPAATGSRQMVAPGASEVGYTLGSESRAEELIAELRGWAVSRKNENAAKALAALDGGSDPTLWAVYKNVRPAVTTIWKTYEGKVSAARAERYLTREGVQAAESAFATERDAALAAAQEQLTAQLQRVTDELTRKRNALRVANVTREDTHAAFDLIYKLQRTTPAHGLAELCLWLKDAGDAAVSEALPMLKSLYDQAGAYHQNSSLLELIRLSENTLDGGWIGSVLDARLDRAARLADDLKVFFYLAKTDGQMLNAVVSEGSEIIAGRERGEFALFPDRPPPSAGAPEDRPSNRIEDLPRGSFRRVFVPSERRALDSAARLAQEE